MAETSPGKRIELLEESLAECLRWIVGQDVYDDQLDVATAWLPRLEQLAGADGLAPLAPLFDDVYVRIEEMPAELGALFDMVRRAHGHFGPDGLDGVLDRARLRRQVELHRQGELHREGELRRQGDHNLRTVQHSGQV